MATKTTKQFSPVELRDMRTKLGLPMKSFWGALGYTLSRGCSYETGKTEIPQHVHRLVYLQYVLRIPTNIDSDEFAVFEKGLKHFNPARVITARKKITEGKRVLTEAMKELGE